MNIWSHTKITPGVSFTSKNLAIRRYFARFWLQHYAGHSCGVDFSSRYHFYNFDILIVAYVIFKMTNIPSNIAVLIGVGSSICGGSAIAARAAPVIKADDQDIAQAISTVFFFNVIAASVFPTLGDFLGLTNTGFGLFAGTAVNDTSSVTATAAVWDSMHPGAQTLEYATIVKLTRTLAIIPICLGLASYQVYKDKQTATGESDSSVNIAKFSHVSFCTL